MFRSPWPARRRDPGPHPARAETDAPDDQDIPGVDAASLPTAARLTPQVMLGQFALMQQQVLDVVQQQMSAQFHQVIQVMAHMIDTLHRDQSDLIRREFDRVRELTDEIQALSTRAGAAGPSPRPTRPLSRRFPCRCRVRAVRPLMTSMPSFTRG